jgi:SapC protein
LPTVFNGFELDLYGDIMSNYQLLNNIEHADLRIVTDHGPQYGDDLQYVMTFPLEFRRAQAHYPIFFQKDANTGRFFPLLLLGFEARQNLFLTEDGWDASYVPLSIRRHPFVIGFQETSGQVEDRQAVITIDVDSPRVSRTEGEPLFLDHGGSSGYLTTMTEILEDIQLGLEMNDEFVDALSGLDLIESVNLEIKLQDGASRQLLGLYTINEDKLADLSGDDIARLHSTGHLQSIYMILASLSCFSTLITRRNQQPDIEALSDVG